MLEVRVQEELCSGFKGPGENCLGGKFKGKNYPG